LTGQEEIAKEVENEPIRSGFVSQYNINIVREGMRQTVTAGSARSLNDLKVAAAGKTGTAQWSTKKPTHAWFTGFAPFDKPEVTVTILIEEGGEGSDAAVPVAKELLTWYFDSNKK
jgi:cell division protein FtsI/penicillin-binding protein 2